MFKTELTSIFGINIAPEEIAAWNPSFDVTPCSLIRGIITDVGVVEASKDSGSDGIIDIPTFLGSKGLSLKCQNAAVPTSSPTGYMKLDESNIGNYLVSTSKLVDILGTNNVGDLTIAEVGDGKIALNIFVFNYISVSFYINRIIIIIIIIIIYSFILCRKFEFCLYNKWT